MAGKVTFKKALRGQIDVPRVIEMDWTADSVDGSVPEGVSPVVHGNVTRITTIPDGDNAPSDYDLVVMDVELIDIMAGGGAGRSGTGRGQIIFENPVSVNSTLTISITGQTKLGAKGKVLIYLDRIET